MTRTAMVALGLITAAFACACSGDTMVVDGGADASAPFEPSCQPGAPVPAFAAVQTIFTSSCTVGMSTACHGVNGHRGELTLASGMSYAQIVGHDSSEVSLVRVAPGDIANSYMMRKVASLVPSLDYHSLPECETTGDRNQGPCGTPMPQVAGQSLTNAQLTTLRDWICGGAPNE